MIRFVTEERSPKTIRTDILLVGAGPIGIELAVALKKGGFDYAHVDAGQIGWTISWYAPQTHFFSSPERIEIAGVPLQTLDQTKATREEYLAYLRAVVIQFDLDIRTFQRVVSLARLEGGGFEARTLGPGNEETRWEARRVVLAIGDMHRPRQIGVPGEELPHVSHYFGDPHLYFRRKVVIVGGKNSAIEAAIRCVRVGADVTLCHRGGELDAKHVKFWLLPEINAMIRDGRMRFLSETKIRGIKPGSVLLEATGTGELSEIDAESVLLLTGYEQDTDLFVRAGVALEGVQRRPVFDRGTMETNVPGLYVAGTASAGTQSGGVKEFIETSHVHVERILASLRGEPPPTDSAPDYEMPES
ncbi:MAG: NAD(P)-binding domain-containing protein [Thermoanaerobaculia bacterium]